MISRIIRRAARLMLPRVQGGADVGQQVALDSLPFCPETVIKGYLNGFFPMADENGSICWKAPPEREVIPIDGFHVSKNLGRLVRQQRFEIRIDTAFDQVIRSCAEREETWITDQIIDVYRELHAMGVARSVEAWQNGELAGGLYGISIGKYFATESLFHNVRDAGKVAFMETFQLLQAQGFLLHDVQYKTKFLSQFGSQTMPGPDFRRQLMQAIVQHGRFELSKSDEEFEASSRETATVS